MFIKSQILRSPHAFSTRQGGVSTLEHTSSLNLAFRRGDEDHTVLENLKIFASNVGFEPESVISLHQIHSDTVYKVGRENCGEGYFIRENIGSGDGYITDEIGVTLGVKSADCVPILFEAEKDKRIVAVGAVHAGWRGTVSRIAAKCCLQLCKEYGVSPKDIRAAIGPCIHSCCYEVGEDLRLAVAEGLGESYLKFVPYVKKKIYCDLPAINKALLIESGIPESSIEVLGYCTCCRPDLFFSHRYSGGVRGTMLSVIFKNN